MIGRDDLRWDALADVRRRPEDKPWGGFRVLCRDEDGVAQAWASYKVESRWTDGRPHGTAEVADLCGASPTAEARLWRFLTELDLISTVKAVDRPVDDVLPWLLTDARAAKSSGARDFLWVRPLDVAAAARRQGLHHHGTRRARGRGRTAAVRRPVRARSLAGGRDVSCHDQLC